MNSQPRLAPTLKDKLLLTILLFFLLAIGFLSGRLSIKAENMGTQEEIKEIADISTTVPTINFSTFDNGILYGKANDKDMRIFVNNQVIERKDDNSFFVDTSGLKAAATAKSNSNGNINAANTPPPATFKFVASKNSKVYHPIGSSSANRISVKNRIYFTSKEEAKAKGFEPGKDVK